ncbi:MAG: hypothetical protein KGI27_04680 [Thaumarchaeota archaeon]|nr:hypothetical protein [Nitrososphaerota archaeon]
MKYKYSILICGKISSGKTSLIKHLSNEFKIPVTSFGKMIKDKVGETSKINTRKQLQDFGYDLFISSGARKILEIAIDHSGSVNSETMIFDGVRHESVFEEIKNISQKTLLIFLDARRDLRFLRYGRYIGSDNLSLAEFAEIDDHPIERGIDKLKEYSNLTIDASLPFDKVCSTADMTIQNFLAG